MILPINKLVDNRYIPTKFIASGGMAEIYEAHDTYCHKAVALKVIKEEFKDSVFELERFKNEARYASMFSHHHIIKIFNIGKYLDNFFISFELMRGKTLKDLLDDRGYLSLGDTVNYVLQLLDATKYIHQRKVLHNDIKPENIFMFLDGNIKLIDFGIATHIGEEGDKINASILYTAPEVLRSGRYTVQSDIYATGVLIYELLTGKNPFDKNLKSEEAIEYRLVAEVPSIKGKVHFVDFVDDIDYVIQKATSKVLNNRYKNDEEITMDLMQIKEGKHIVKKNIFQRIFGK